MSYKNGFHRRSDSGDPTNNQADTDSCRQNRISRAGLQVASKPFCMWKVTNQEQGCFWLITEIHCAFKLDRVQVTKNLLGMVGWCHLSNKQANKRRCLRNASARHSSDEQGADSRAKQFYRMVQIRSSRLCCNLQVWCRGSMSLFMIPFGLCWEQSCKHEEGPSL